MPSSSFYGKNPSVDEIRDLDAIVAEVELARDETLGLVANAASASNNAYESMLTASTKATEANTSAAAAASSATTAAGYVSTAGASATAAANSASAASTSASNASSSASSATTSASAASVSATNAAGSAATATTKASEAATSASTATTKASEASASASTATTKASDAATSAIQASNYRYEAQNWANYMVGPVNGFDYSARYHAFAAADSASSASTSESNASTSASSASTSATNAATSATNAASSATVALSAKVAAESAANMALAAFDSFDDRYLGAKTADPTLDNDGGTLVGGTLYFNTTTGTMRLYTGSAWVDAYVSGSGFVLKTGDTMTGALTLSGNATANLHAVPKQQLDTGLATKANTSHTHTISDVTNLQTTLDGKASTSHSHTISDVTGLQTALDAKLATAGGTISGSLGIGVTAAYRVHIKGANGDQLAIDNAGERYSQITLRTNGVDKSYLWWDNTNSIAGVQSTGIYVIYTNGSNERVRVDTSGNVGIGTSPSYKLHVAGTIYGTSSNYGVYANSTGNYAVYATSSASAGVYALATAGTGNGIFASATGNYGVYGATSSSAYGGVIGFAQNAATYGILGYNNQWALYGNASTYISGTYQGSDERLKENIWPLDDALAKLRNLSIKTFDWKAGSDQHMAGRVNDVGVIAQEAMLVMPDLVKEATAPAPVEGQTPSLNQELGTFYTAEYGRLIPYLVRAVQQLEARIAELEGAS